MIDQAIILAAGLGTRLRPLTNDCPKPMLPLGDKRLIEYHIENLAKAGVKNIVIHVSYMSDFFQKYIPDGSKWGVNVVYSISEHLLGTGGGIKSSQKLLTCPDKPYICVNSDIYTDFDYLNLVEFQKINNINIDAKELWGYLILVKNPLENPDGDFNISPYKSCLSENICKVQPKACDNPEMTGPYTFSGIALYHPKITELNRTKYSKVHKDFSEYSIIEHIHNNESKFIASVYNSTWYDIGTVERYEHVNNLLRQKNASMG